MDPEQARPTDVEEIYIKEEYYDATLNTDQLCSTNEDSRIEEAADKMESREEYEEWSSDAVKREINSGPAELPSGGRYLPCLDNQRDSRPFNLEHNILPQVVDLSQAHRSTEMLISPVKEIIKSLSIKTRKLSCQYFVSSGDITQSQDCKEKKSDTVICLICNKVYNMGYYLEKHLDSHETVGDHNCFMCRKNFINSVHLDNHIHIMHTTDGLYECSICKEKYNEFSNLKGHFEIHKVIKNYQCRVCKTKLFRDIDLVLHSNCHMSKKEKCKCAICNLHFENKLVLKEHAKVHKTAVFKCADCSKVFDEKKKIALHMKTHRVKIKKSRKKFIENDVTLSKIEELNDHKADKKIIDLTDVKKCDVSADSDNFNTNSNEPCNDFLEENKESQEKRNDLSENCFVNHANSDSRNNLNNNNRNAKSYSVLRNTQAVKKSKKTKDEIYHCAKCSKVFNVKSSYEKHIKFHESTPKETYACSICKKQFLKKSLCYKHEKIHDKNKSITNYECLLCKRKYKDPTDLKTHILKIHSGLRPYECVICRKTFPKSYELKIHFMTHTGETRYECSLCGKKFKKNNELNIHMMSHTGDKPYVCAACGKTFSKSWYLKEHMRNHTGETPHECDQCGMKFKTSGGLRKHIMVHTGEKPFQCLICDARFTKNSSLKGHSVIHTGEKPFACMVCGKAFNGKSALGYHMKIHTGINLEEQILYECDYCKRLFNRKSNLKDHIRLHTGEKPHQCFICKRSFTLKTTLNKHMRVHS